MLVHILPPTAVLQLDGLQQMACMSRPHCVPVLLSNRRALAAPWCRLRRTPLHGARVRPGSGGDFTDVYQMTISNAEEHHRDPVRRRPDGANCGSLQHSAPDMALAAVISGLERTAHHGAIHVMTSPEAVHQRQMGWGPLTDVVRPPGDCLKGH